jgi:hypothetical protein
MVASMSIQTHDVSLNGQQYMLLPGTYKSYPDGNLYVDSRLGRQVLSDFTAGMAGPKLNTRTLPVSALYGEASLGAWPAPWPLGANAVGPAPKRHASGLSVPGATVKTVVRMGDYAFIAAGTELWRWDHGAGFTLRYTAAHPIVDMVRIGTLLYLAFGTAAAIGRWDDSGAGAFTPSVVAQNARRLASIGLRLWANNASAPNEVRLYTNTLGSSAESLDGPVQNVTIYDDAVLIATERSLWAHKPTGAGTYDFTHWGVVSADGLQNADDFVWMTVFQGRLMTWQGGRAVIYDKQRGWWRHAGLEAASSHGAALVNGWLIVSVTPRGGATPQLWGYNGSGWWLMDEGVGGGIAAARGDRLIGWAQGSGEIHYWNMGAGRDPAEIVAGLTVDTALLDAGQPDQPKFWTRIGVELARADPGSVGEWGVQLLYSTDAGTTWTAAGVPETVTAATASISRSVGQESAYLRIRVQMSQTTGLPPHLLAAWAEYEVLNESVRRRRWQFKVAASDRTLTRAGSLDPRGGEEVRDELWTLFDGPASFVFTDVDGSAHTARLIGLREEWTRPSDLPKVGAHTTFEVVLVEL